MSGKLCSNEVDNKVFEFVRLFCVNWRSWHELEKLSLKVIVGRTPVACVQVLYREVREEFHKGLLIIVGDITIQYFSLHL